MSTGADQTPDFNNLEVWLKPKIEALNLSVEGFAAKAGVSRASLYFYLKDKSRPSEQAMVKICQTLGVPLEEGLKQYTPKKVGRPRM